MCPNKDDLTEHTSDENKVSKRNIGSNDSNKDDSSFGTHDIHSIYSNLDGNS